MLRADGICRARYLPFGPLRTAGLAHVCCAMERPVHVEYFHDHERVESILFEGALDIEDGELRPDHARPASGRAQRSETERFALPDR